MLWRSTLIGTQSTQEFRWPGSERSHRWHWLKPLWLLVLLYAWYPQRSSLSTTSKIYCILHPLSSKHQNMRWTLRIRFTCNQFKSYGYDITGMYKFADDLVYKNNKSRWFLDYPWSSFCSLLYILCSSDINQLVLLLTSTATTLGDTDSAQARVGLMIKYNCPNCKMYLSKLQNEFIQNVNCVWIQPPWLLFTRHSGELVTASSANQIDDNGSGLPESGDARESSDDCRQSLMTSLAASCCLSFLDCVFSYWRRVTWDTFQRTPQARSWWSVSRSSEKFGEKIAGDAGYHLIT